METDIPVIGLVWMSGRTNSGFCPKSETARAKKSVNKEIFFIQGIYLADVIVSEIANESGRENSN
jgi:hypothetical protein